MPKRIKSVPAAEDDKQEQMKATRERLEAMGVAEDTVPDPASGQEEAGGKEQASGLPDHASVQPGWAALNGKLHKRWRAAPAQRSRLLRGQGRGRQPQSRHLPAEKPVLRSLASAHSSSK